MTALHQRTVHTGDSLRYPRAAAFAAVCVVLAGGGHVLASSSSVPSVPAAAASVAAAAAHPAVPPWWTWVAGFVVVLAAALPLAGRSRSLPGIAGLLIACQLVLHTLFVLGPQAVAAAVAHAPAGAGADGTGVSDAALMARASQFVCGAHLLNAEQARQILVDAGVGIDLTDFGRAGTVAAGGGSPAHGHAASADAWLAVLPSLPMLLGHALAGLAAGWLLRRGDLALLRLVRLAGQDPADAPAVLRPLRSALTLARALCAGLPGTPGRLPAVPRAAFGDVPAPPTAPLLHTVIRRGPPARAHVFALAA
ncbi:hypothetical protein [Streptomyces abyssomicinicus]|uniref:hypothetical protein n=1 Tax=Streptomyces abyssomicinicus TaxID=574929 RepID=UPI00124F79D6|nr:hypothetical protein [Streptomyces abyssomicinicus]